MRVAHENLTDKQTNRNFGIDLLRLVAMFMIIILHILGQGGVLPESKGYYMGVGWLMEIIAYCAVDCYAIISGYVGYSDIEKPYNYKKFLSFWVQVFTYSFGITLIAFLLRPEVIGMKTLIKSMIPIASNQYWYASAYAGLFFIIPWINKLFRSCTKRECSCFVFAISIVFIIYVTVANKISDCFKLNSGYSFVWLSILYVVGVWMKKCDIPSRLKNWKIIIGMVCSVLLTWGIKIFFSEKIFSDVFVNYTSITIVYVAFSFVAIFSKFKLGKISTRIVICFAPASFGVYLIHVQPLVWKYFIADAFTWILDYNWWLLPLLVLASALCIFVCCILIEKTRLILFRFLRINRLIDSIADLICKVLRKTYKRITNIQ